MTPNRVGLAVAFLFGFVSYNVQAQTSDQWIYTDSLEVPWQDWSWSTTLQFNSTEQAFAGSYSIKVTADPLDWGGLQFVSNDGSWIDVNPANYSALEFAVYATTPGGILGVTIERRNGAQGPETMLDKLPQGQWVLVSIPMADLNPSSITIHKVVIRNMTDASNTYYVDALRFVGLPQPNTAPPTPVLFKPDSAATDVSKRPTLTWLSSLGATSYRLQVAEDASFNSVIFDDSTLSLTLQRITGLSISTDYYWRVRGENSTGVSAFSSAWKFTTAPLNTEDNWIYQDSLFAPWTTVSSFGATVTLQQTTNVYDGTYSTKAVAADEGFLAFRSGDWGTIVDIDPADYDSLAFALYTGSQSLTVDVHVQNDDSGGSTGVTYSNLASNTWFWISIPMDSLNQEGYDIHHIHIHNYSGASRTFYVDQVRLAGHPAAAGPSAPVLALPADSSQNQSLFTTLTWFHSDITTLDYQLQVSENSNFSSFVFNDSTLTDTTRLMTNLEDSTTYYWRVSARDSMQRGPWSEIWRFTTRPDTIPTLVALPVDMTVPPVISQSNRFIYTGPGAVQLGVDTSAIDPVRFATVRGKVLNQDNAPLPGVRVSILNHPQFGYTFTRADGFFDMVANGGGTLTVDFTKDGYLQIQRTVDAQWQDYAILDSVIMIRLDSVVTTIDFSDTIEVAKGSVSTDASGSRQPTLLFRQGTEAKLVSVTGDTTTLSTINVRATEFSVGSQGPAKMPVQLPPTSGYTYCVELSADEAVEARSVLFTQAVPFYVDNFLSFPVGLSVPFAFYDRESGDWVPVDDGRVMAIVSVSGGQAEIDADGDGSADDPDSLLALGIDTAERTKLATLYSSGDTLWRMQVTHFSAYDCNYGVIPPTGAKKPSQPEPDKNKPEIEDDCLTAGSSIGIQRQTLGESVPITGTPFVLSYSSERVSGRVFDRSLSIPLTGSSVSSLIQRIDVEITIEGKKFTQSFSPAASLTYFFGWDGKDVYGRQVWGERRVNLRIGYVYHGFYQKPPAMRQSFAVSSGDSTLIPSREEIILWQEWNGTINYPDARGLGLGGWMLQAHHYYDVGGRVLNLGDGTKRDADAFDRVIETFAGNGGNTFVDDSVAATTVGLQADAVAAGPSGEIYIADNWNGRVYRVSADGLLELVAGNGDFGDEGDGGPAVDAPLGCPVELAIGPDGSLYISDNCFAKIRKVDPDGIIHTIAGTGDTGYSGDDSAAVSAEIGNIYDLEVGPDGSLYLMDVQNNVVRRISPGGLINTVAGTGTFGSSGDGGPALDADIAPLAMKVAADGSIYVSDHLIGPARNRVRKITPDGIIQTIAGTGDFGYTGDGGSALSATLGSIIGLEVDSDGGVYLADGSHNVIRRVSQEGIIATYAGIGQGGFSGDGGPATQARLRWPEDLSLGADGSLFIADFDNNRVRKISAPLQGFTAGDILIPSEDAGEIYEFDQAGKHRRTMDALTGATRFEFVYDSTGLLETIRDIDSLETTIQRDSEGGLTGIISPFGQTTTIRLDAAGYIDSVANPANEIVLFSYSADGLMTDMTEAGSNVYTFTHDTLGRLTLDEDPAGGSKSLTRTEFENGYEVLVTTAEGRKTTYKVERLATGGVRTTTTDEAGLSTVTVNGTNGVVTTTSPDGTVTTVTTRPEPRFGMQAPLSTVTVQTPGGLQSTVAQHRIVTGFSGSGVSELTDSVRINGRIYKTIFNADSMQFRSITPENRQSLMRIDDKGRVIAEWVPGVDTVNYTYDSQGRLTEARQGGRISSFTYDSRSRLESATDPLDRTTAFEYDSVGRITKQTLPDNREILYSYDSNGNLLNLTPPGRPAHAFDYTSVNLTNRYLPPLLDGDTTATLYFYNLDRQITETLRPDSIAVTVDYDSVGCGTCGGPVGRPKTITFDRGDLEFRYNPITGLLDTLIAPGNDTLFYSYDGSLPKSVRWSGDVNGSVGVVYDNNFRVTKQIVNGVDTVNFGYSNDGLLTTAGRMTIARDSETGRITGTTLDSVTTSQTYNEKGELASYEAKFGSTTLFATTYTRDSLGRITELEETVQGETKTFAYAYDTTGRVQQVWRNDTLISTYTYDDNGNRLSHIAGIDTVLATYDGQDRLLRYGNASYTYRENGELSTKVVGTDTTRYVYDAIGNLTRVDLPNGDLVEYVIDGQNRRIAKKVNGAFVRKWIYADQLAPVAELDSSDNVVARFAGSIMIKDEEIYRIISDHLGSARLVVNTSTGSVAQRLDYDEFGIVIVDSNSNFQPFVLARGLTDIHTKLVRFGARDYDASTGRWTTKDPIGFAGGMNVYVYCANDPVNSIDLFGLDNWRDVARTWFFELGNSDSRTYGSEHEITQELMNDEGVAQALEKWALGGYKDGFEYPYNFGLKEYLRELLTLDGTGSFLGGYLVSFRNCDDGSTIVTVKNPTGWESGTRSPIRSARANPSIEDMLNGSPFTVNPKSIVNNRKRSDPGPGGTFTQYYKWRIRR